MKSAPQGWPRITPCLVYSNAPAAIDWLCRAFGFEVRLKVEGEGNTIVHSELVLGDGLITVSSGKGGTWGRSPMDGGVASSSLMVYVDDVEAHCARARAAGAKLKIELKTSDYGEEYWSDRGYGAEDVEGHIWYFAQRLRGPGQKG